MKYKCIIFDCDGVLVDSEFISNETLVEMAQSVGLKIDMNIATKEFTGKSLESNFQFIESSINKKLPETFEAEFRNKSFKKFREELKPIKGIINLLPRLKIPFCVASSGPREKIILNLTTTSLIGYFNNNIFSCYDIGSWKPNPEIFLHAAKEMGFQPHECVVIEDTKTGIEAAKNGGFDVYAYVNDKLDKTLLNSGAIIFNNMDELEKLLN